MTCERGAVCCEIQRDLIQGVNRVRQCETFWLDTYSTSLHLKVTSKMNLQQGGTLQGHVIAVAHETNIKQKHICRAQTSTSTNTTAQNCTTRAPQQSKQYKYPAKELSGILQQERKPVLPSCGSSSVFQRLLGVANKALSIIAIALPLPFEAPDDPCNPAPRETLMILYW